MSEAVGNHSRIAPNLPKAVGDLRQFGQQGMTSELFSTEKLIDVDP
jgi:hypothetical protein